MTAAHACLGGLWATDLREVSRDPAVLDSTGRWAVVVPYTGEPTFARFENWSTQRHLSPRSWIGPSNDAWTSSLSQAAYVAGVNSIRADIARGRVYQVNLCRVLSAPLPHPSSVAGLFERIMTDNPAPHAGFVEIPDLDLAIASASPELFLRREGDLLTSGPIKGTGRTASDLQAKDRAENVMIVDLIRNDLGRVCEPGSINVPDFLSVEQHPGLVHLVSRVSGRLRAGFGWREILDATFPPGSVTGAPKSSALDIINELETMPRSVYCGAIGWVDADTNRAELAVAIRTFWAQDGIVHFGTGAGITWGSDPQSEWEETQLKASRLIGIASN
jgi:para-aminobenzoate synthetase component 1